MTSTAAFLLGLTIGFILFVAIPVLILSITQVRREWREVERLKTRLDQGGVAAGGTFFPVRYWSSNQRGTTYSMYQWHLVGILAVTDAEVHFFARCGPWSLLDLDLSDYETLEWLGTLRGLARGFFWFEVDSGGDRHRFSSAEGLTKVFSRQRTLVIFEALEKAGSHKTPS